MRGSFTLVTISVLAVLGAPAASAHPGHEHDGGVTTINGQQLPGVLAPLVNPSTMLDTIGADGQRVVVTQGTRKAGTRAPIHVHEYGGVTCVLTGTVTPFVEGQEPVPYPAGTCYYMPPNTPMAAVNLGTEDVFLTDSFTLPPDAPAMTVLEPGWTDPSPADVG
ncbi:Cupin domain [Mycolicibacterium phlei]|jgi:quercetin dioxygenase-like cupin family protein|nr:Cupin domain protein [Mycolicibacterium phlei]STZ21556.1 Cupin domain [Mycolicibacterium phlei]VEG11192.1 Cupin domain [Mycobacteroides chelonae]